MIRKSKKWLLQKQKIFIQDRWNGYWQNISFKKEPYGTNKSIKYFIGYNEDDDDTIRPPCIKLPEMIGFVKWFDSSKTMSFKVTVKKLLQNYLKV